MNDFSQAALPVLYSEASERAVIGALLVDGDAIDRVCDSLLAKHFFIPDLAEIYAAMSHLATHNQRIEPVAVAELLDKRGRLASIGGLQALTSLAWSNAGSANIRRQAEIVVEKAMMRTGIGAASSLIERLQSGDWAHSPAEVLQEVAASLESISDIADGEGAFSAAEVAHAAIAEIQASLDAGGRPRGVQTGLPALDKHLGGGFRPGDLVIVAGRPGMGKTVLAMNIAERVAQQLQQQGGKSGAVAVFSMEMGREQLGMRQIASLGGVDLAALMEPERLADDDYARMTAAVATISELPIEIDFRPALTVAQVRARCRKLRRKHQGLALIVVDYLQLMVHPGSENRVNEITKISGGLKALAKEMGCPVLALSQLSRKVEERSDKHPQMADLRESGSIEQDADTILFAYRDEYYHPDSPMKGVAEIGIGKQRMGESGKWTPVRFEGQYSRFRHLAGDYQPPPPVPPPARKRGFDA
jgi:replicative DNA helicase